MSKHIEVVIKEIISDRGAEVLNEPKVFCSMLDDLIPEDINSRTILRRTLISYPEISNSIYSLLIVDVPQKEQIRKLEFLMKNNYGISIEWTQAVLFYFGFATSPTVSVSTENKTDSVTSKESNDKNKTAPSDSIFYDNIICGDKDYVFGVTETNEVISCGSGGEDYSRLVVETVKKWKNILYIYKAWSLEYGFLLIGLQTNGSVVAVSSNKSDPRLACQKWTDITSISAGYYHVVGVKSDGTVVACGENRFGKCDVSGWNNIKSVQAFHTWTLGIKNDGNIVWTGDKKTLGSFSDIDSVNNLFVLGIKKDKTLAIADDFYTWKSHDPTDWLYSLNNIKKVASSYGTIVVLFENGTVAGDNYKVGNIESVKNWKNIIDIVTDGEYVVGLCEDGTLNIGTMEREINKPTDISHVVKIQFRACDYFLYIMDNGRVAELCLGSKERWTNDMRNWRLISYTKEYLDKPKSFSFTSGDKYIGEWKNGKMNGKGTYIWKNGEKLVGEFRNSNAFNCEGVFHFKGCRYYGAFVNGKKSGYGKLIHDNGNRYEGEFLDGDMHEGVFYWHDNTQWKGILKNNEPFTGEGTWHFKDGTVKSGKWKNGRKKLFG